MADRVPLIVDAISSQIKELPSGDDLFLDGSGIIGISSLGVGVTTFEPGITCQVNGISKFGIGTFGYQFPTANTGIGSQFLALDATGTNLIFTTPAGETTGAAGSEGQVQFNFNERLTGSNIWFTTGAGTTTGRTGINTDVPFYTLDVNGDINFSGGLYIGGNLFIGGGGGGGTGFVTFSSNVVFTGIVTFTNNVSFTGVTTFLGPVFADTITANTFITPSDKTLKKNITTLEKPLDKIEKIRGVKFEWKSNSSVGVGVVAQEVEKVFPDLVTTYNGKKHINYDSLVAVLIESVKELKNEIATLKKIYK